VEGEGAQASLRSVRRWKAPRVRRIATPFAGRRVMRPWEAVHAKSAHRRAGSPNRSGSPERIAAQRSPPCVATSSRQEVSEPYRVGAKLLRRAIDAGGAELRTQKVPGTAPGPWRLDWLQFGRAIAKASPVLGEAGASHPSERLASHPPQHAALVGDHGRGRRGSDDARSCSRIVASVAEVDERRAAHRGQG